jgi:hypothetical protein
MSVRSMVEKTVRGFQPVAAQKGITVRQRPNAGWRTSLPRRSQLTHELGNSGSLGVFGDQHRLGQVLSNLLRFVLLPVTAIPRALCQCIVQQRLQIRRREHRRSELHSSARAAPLHRAPAFHQRPQQRCRLAHARRGGPGRSNTVAHQGPAARTHGSDGPARHAVGHALPHRDVRSALAASCSALSRRPYDDRAQRQRRRHRAGVQRPHVQGGSCAPACERRNRCLTSERGVVALCSRYPQAFQQFRAGKLQEGGGSGLGLSIVRQIVDLHGV